MMTVALLLVSVVLVLVSAKALEFQCDLHQLYHAYDDAHVLQKIERIRAGVQQLHANRYRELYEAMLTQPALLEARRALWRALKSIQNHKQRWMGALEHIEWLNQQYEDLSVKHAQLLGELADRDDSVQHAYGLVAALQDKLEQVEFLAKHYERGREGMRLLFSKALREKVEADQRAALWQGRAEQAERAADVLTAELGKLAHVIPPNVLAERRSGAPRLVA